MPDLTFDVDIVVNITLLNWKQSQTRALEFSTWVLLKMGISVSSVRLSWFALYIRGTNNSFTGGPGDNLLPGMPTLG